MATKRSCSNFHLAIKPKLFYKFGWFFFYYFDLHGLCLGVRNIWNSKYLLQATTGRKGSLGILVLCYSDVPAFGRIVAKFCHDQRRSSADNLRIFKVRVFRPEEILSANYPTRPQWPRRMEIERWFYGRLFFRTNVPRLRASAAVVLQFVRSTMSTRHCLHPVECALSIRPSDFQTERFGQSKFISIQGPDFQTGISVALRFQPWILVRTLEADLKALWKSGQESGRFQKDAACCGFIRDALSDMHKKQTWKEFSLHKIGSTTTV